MTEAALAIERLEYRYPGAPGLALAGVDLRVGAGEFVVLAGRSGSGKSTLLRAACGLVPHFHGGEIAGAVAVAGRSTRETGPAELAAAVGFVAQEPETQVVSTTVRAELELPLELRGAGAGEIARAVEEAALALAIEPLLDRTTDSLSGGELQRVALGAALVAGPPLLLLDEPTSQLDPVAGEELIALLRRLNEESGIAVVLGEHRLERCLAAADRVVALDAGRVLYDGPPGRFGAAMLGPAPELATPIARLFDLAGLPASPVTVKQLVPAGVAARPADRRPVGEPPAGEGLALRCRRLRVELGSRADPREALRGLDLVLDPGERVALMGPNGAGKTTLLRAAAGILAPASGSIEVPAGAAMLSQRPDDYFVRERVDEELPGDAGAAALAAVGLDVAGDADPRDLSGGERQRLALAIAMAGRGAGGEPGGLVCLDEPTRGLDRARKEDLAGWIGGLAGRGAGVLVATHDVEFAARFATRVVLLARGRVIADGAPGDLLGGGWYFATETARVTGGRAITPEGGAPLLAAPRDPLAREEAR
ncbi:MAG: ATP-binding cassette domain-containing protein [Acidobacteria bacterium]|nr:MAG: ATP-binding cassette domain-containing protein [Acidobacteriota bacterium]